MSEEQEPKESARSCELPERGVGILAIVAGAVFAYIGIVSPLVSAARHEEKVTFILEAAVIAPLALALGVLYTVLGDTAAKYLGPRQRPSRLGWVFYLFFTAIGVLAYLWLKSRLRAYGYEA
jgi:threonine/homoserine/homoserine lactone efflux protein